MEKTRPHLLATAALCASAIAAAALGTPSGPDAGPGADAQGLGGRVAALAAIGSRAEGSAGERAAFDYIERELRSAGLEPSTSGFSDASGGYSTSRIVEARLPGARADELAVLVPVNSWVDARDSSEGAYGIALALEEASSLAVAARAGAEIPISLRFVFLGAEKRGRASGGGEASLGSSAWIARQAGQSRLAALYLNFGDVPARVAVHNAGAGVLSPYWLYEGARRALEPSGIEYALDANRIQAYRLGLASDYGPAAPYLEAGIPAIELRGESVPGAAVQAGGRERWFETFLEGFSWAERAGFEEDWDRHYFIFQLGKLSAVLREKTYVAFLVVSFALVAASLLIATVARRKAAKQLLRKFPAITAEVVALFIALALVFLSGKGIARLDGLVLGSQGFWRLAPRVFAAARILSSFLLFLSLLSFLVEKRALTPNPYFYEFAALACLAADSLVFSVADLSASFYFIWALVLVEVSLAARRRWATLAAYVLMYLPLLVIASELAARPELASYGKLVAPGYLGVLALSALTLPFFVFTASPLLFFARPGAAARKKAVILFAGCAIAVEALALAYAGASFPVAGSRRTDLRVSETIDQDAGTFEAELSGLRRLGKGSLDRGGTRLEYDCPGDKASLRGADGGKRIGISERASPFLDRVDETVAIRFETAPYQIDLSLGSESDILIYDCNLPFKVAVDGKSASIFAGVNPGKELVVSLTVPASFRSRLAVVARYLSALEHYTLSSGAALADGGLAVRASFDIGMADGDAEGSGAR